MSIFCPTAARAVAVIIKDGQILLMRRIKHNRDYFIFGGGTIETGETHEQALLREVSEEFSLIASDPSFLFHLVNGERDEYWFLIRKFSGVVALGGPEKERMTSVNQYIPTWKSLVDFGMLATVFPKEGQEKLLARLQSNTL